jgi:hypothetical protein
MKQTAVEYLIKQFSNVLGKIQTETLQDSVFLIDAIKQAKEMEKQQIIDFSIWFNNRNNEYQSYENIAEQYYNETFNK